MANAYVLLVLLFAIAVARIDPSACEVVKGKVSCLDCTHHYPLSDIKVSVKCEGVKKLGVANTEEDGSFKVEIPKDTINQPPSLNCLAKILGGADQLYASMKSQVSQIVRSKEPNSYTISTPLSFMTSCPQNTDCKSSVGSSKTVDLPVPPEWGLAPTSYYVPFIPIIGIP